MASENEKMTSRRHLVFGSIHITIFFTLIFLGIYVKRALGRPDFMMLFHGPAAVFLALASGHFTFRIRERNRILRKKALLHLSNIH